jgi:phage terminase large subunit
VLATIDVPRIWRPQGAADRLFDAREPEVLLCGPAGTGKSRGCLEYLHHLCTKFAGIRAAIVRKTRKAITQSALVTWEKEVLHPLDRVRFRTAEQEYRYPEGSVVVVSGLDRPEKIMSSQYDVIYVQEATELTEDDWESLTTRLRNNVLPWQQLIADCNPAAPVHWLKQRCDQGRTRLLESRHADNPTVTADYLAKLDALTGVRLLRLRQGLWAAAEGLIYDGWDSAVHLVDGFPIPRDWPRYWVVDFGYTNPFVWQAWASDPDGRLYRYRELYRTQRLVEDHARDIRRVTAGDPRPVAVICDHDAEDRATLERHLGVRTLAAHKAVSPGIQAVASRLKVAGDGRPRLFLLRDALDERDPLLVEAKRPTCTDEEVESYVWNVAGGRKKGEEPLKENDHGCDCTRYLVAYRDLKARSFASW